MFGCKTRVYLKKVEPRQEKPDKKGDDPITVIILHGVVQTEETEIFDDLDFGGLRKGLDHILSGALPVMDVPIELNFVDPGVMDVCVGRLDDLHGTFEYVKTQKISEHGHIIIQLGIRILKFTEKEAGDLVGYLGSIQEVTLHKIQEELPITKK